MSTPTQTPLPLEFGGRQLPLCEHTNCVLGCICPACGVNVYAVDDAARTGGPVAQTMTAAEWAHHTGRCRR